MKIIKGHLGRCQSIYPALEFKNGEKAQIYSSGVELSVEETHPSLAIGGDMSTRNRLDGLSNESKIELCSYMEKRWAKLKNRIKKLK